MNLKNKLSPINTLSLTCDFWFNQSSKSYLCLTVHYFKDGFNYESSVLSFSAFHERHVGIRVAKTIREKLEEFKIYEKVVCMTTDGAKNMQAMVHHLNNDKIHWIWCIAHKLHLVINHALGFWLSTKKQHSKEHSVSSTDASTSSTEEGTTTTTTTMDVDEQSSFYDDSLQGKFRLLVFSVE